MPLSDLIQMFAALAVTLGLFGVGVVALRRYGPNLVKRLQTAQGVERRLSIVESLVLDPQRRLLLVRIDGAERLILLGEGRIMEAAQSSSAIPTIRKSRS